jgi:hypothetical protein
MDATVTAAFVSGGLAIVAPIVTVLVTKAYERRFLNRLGETAEMCLSGLGMANSLSPP